MNKRLVSVLVALVSAGCVSKTESAGPPGPPAKAKVAAPGAALGRAAKGNDPQVIALLDAALACPASSDSLVDQSCDALKAFRKAKEVAGADATLVNLLEDADPRIRYLGATGMSEDTFPRPLYRADPALAARMVSALGAESSAQVAESLARRVGTLDLEKTGQLEALKAVLKERRHPDAAREVLRHILFANSSARPTYDFMLAMTHDADPKLRFWAVDAFWVGGGHWPAETCAMWKEHLTDEDAEIAGTSAQHLGWSTDDCSAHYDALLSSVEARVKARTTDDKQSFGVGLEKLCENDHATLAQKLKAARLGKLLAADKDRHDFMRMGALDAVAACDHKGSRAFVARYTHDKSDSVAEKAKALLKPARR